MPPPASSASTATRRAGLAQDPGGDDRRLDPGGRSRARGAVHARAARRHEDPRADPRAGLAGSRSWRPAREAVRRALAILAMPQNVAAGAAQLGWRAADLMWRLAGDTSTDFNHYTKRMTLGAVYALDPAGLARRRQRRLGRHPRLPRSPDRRRDEVREVQGADGAARGSHFSLSALPRPAALPAALRLAPASMASLLIITRINDRAVRHTRFDHASTSCRSARRRGSPRSTGRSLSEQRRGGCANWASTRASRSSAARGPFGARSDRVSGSGG